MEETSLKKKTIQGTIWSAADAFLGQGISFIISLLLARMLTDKEYGLIGICLIFNVILNGIVDSGFSNALIRKKEVTDRDYNTMFTTNMSISILLYALLYLASPWIAVFFANTELTALIRVMGLILIINALSITQLTILTKKIDFKTKTKASLISAVCSGILGVTMAFHDFGVWALVAQQLSRQVVYSACLWWFNRWLPKLTFYRDSFHYMWGFGWKLLISGLLNNIWNQLYLVVVGKCYSPSTLGQYTRGYEYANLFSSNLTTIIQRVSFPVLSEIQDDPERIVCAYRKVIRMTMFVTAICMISLGAVAEPLLYCLIGPQWQEAADYLPLICLSMSLYPLHAINLNMLQVQGRSDIFLYLEIIKKIIGIAPIAIGIYIDIYGMLWASIITGIISLYLNAWYTGKKLNYSFWKQLRDVSSSYAIALVIAIAVYFLKELPYSYWVILPLQITIGVLVGTLLCQFFKPYAYEEIKHIILARMRKTKKI